MTGAGFLERYWWVWNYLLAVAGGLATNAYFGTHVGPVPLTFDLAAIGAYYAGMVTSPGFLVGGLLGIPLLVRLLARGPRMVAA